MKEHESASSGRNGHSAPQSQTQPPEGAFSSLIAELQQAVTAEGYLTPTPIQEQCIPHLLEGRDLLGTAQTGTGKTAAFTLPLLEQLSRHTNRPRKGTPRALILAPTRELAAQIGDSIETYGRFLRLRHTVVFGGVNQFHQVKALRHGVDVLVATPGRLLDLMQQKFIHLNEVEIFVLDEVDRMLDMGFIPDVKRVLAKIPKERQTLFFSATMPPKMETLAHTMVRDPVRVAITPEKPAVELIDQKMIFVDKKSKDALLTSLLQNRKIKKALVFTQMKHVANRVSKKLVAAGIRATAIHGNKSQAARIRALDGFKQNHFQVMVATDVAARGLDVDDVTHVINYDMPMEAETYVHRIGRTARAGADGHSISFCTAQDKSCLRSVERLLGKKVPIDKDHAHHCERTSQSSQPTQKQSESGQGKRQHGGRPQGNFARYQSRKRRHRAGR
ncbi:MAG: DEAD/DEAH box helicase [Opitutales bacterium]|nr:DEAD/DEAH box helicase [Opitutales bacterium]